MAKSKPNAKTAAAKTKAKTTTAKTAAAKTKAQTKTKTTVPKEYQALRAYLDRPPRTVIGNWPAFARRHETAPADEKLDAQEFHEIARQGLVSIGMILLATQTAGTVALDVLCHRQFDEPQEAEQAERWRAMNDILVRVFGGALPPADVDWSIFDSADDFDWVYARWPWREAGGLIIHAAWFSIKLVIDDAIGIIVGNDADETARRTVKQQLWERMKCRLPFHDPGTVEFEGIPDALATVLPNSRLLRQFFGIALRMFAPTSLIDLYDGQVAKLPADERAQFVQNLFYGSNSSGFFCHILTTETDAAPIREACEEFMPMLFPPNTNERTPAEEIEANMVALDHLAQHPDPELRCLALRTSRRYEYRIDRAPRLIAALETDPDESVRATAIGQMEDFPKVAYIAPLLRVLADPSSDLRECAADALRSLGPLCTHSPPSNIGLRHRLQQLVPPPEPIPAAEVTRIVEALHAQMNIDRSEDVDVAVACGRAIAAFVAESAATVLIDMAGDSSDANLRRAGIEGLGNQRDARVVPPLLAALHDSDDEIAIMAAKALGDYGVATRDADLLVHLRTVLHDSRSKNVQYAIDSAISCITSATTMPTTT